jgi:hypothetical protein
MLMDLAFFSGADSIRKASIIISCVALENAIKTIEIAINERFFCGSDNEASKIEIIIKI